MSRQTSTETEPDLTDFDNPEWTKADFARARRPEDVLPPEVLAAFPRTRGRPRQAETKEAISIRLDSPVVRHLRALGPGWQTRVNTALSGLIKTGEL